MPVELGTQFQARIAVAAARLQTVSEAQSAERSGAPGWTRKQVLGHLLDSAANNHQRFVRGALYGAYAGPGYDADRWVEIHDYANWSWDELLRSWNDRNAVLSRVVARVPESALEEPCRIGDDQPVTLRFVITDYLRHLDHHVEQITAGLS